MTYLSWILTLFLLGFSGWGLFAYRRQRQRLERLLKAMQSTKIKLLQLEEDASNEERNRESTKEKLRSYLQLMDTLINTIPNPIYFKDIQGVYQGCNQVFAKSILGLTRDRIIGHRPQELPDSIPPGLASTCLRQELKMKEKGCFHAFEAQVQCADGRQREFLFSLAPVTDLKGETSGSVTVLSDLTEKNRAARDRMQKEKLEGVLETAGAVCHEFNQPLQALTGYTDIMAAKLGSGNEIQTDLNKIAKQIDRMREITTKLQGITHYESMDYVDKTKIVDIHKSSQ